MQIYCRFDACLERQIFCGLLRRANEPESTGSDAVFPPLQFSIWVCIWAEACFRPKTGVFQRDPIFRGFLSKILHPNFNFKPVFRQLFICKSVLMYRNKMFYAHSAFEWDIDRLDTPWFQCICRRNKVCCWLLHTINCARSTCVHYTLHTPTLNTSFESWVCVEHFISIHQHRLTYKKLPKNRFEVEIWVQNFA